MFPAADLAPLIQTLRMCVLQVMGLLGTRVRRAPSDWSPENKRIPEPLVVLIGAWMHKRRAMIEALMHRIAAGKLRPPRPYAPREVAERADRAPRPEPALRLPTGRGWITRLAQETFNYSFGFINLLNEPTIKAMVQASPQMVRLWMPLLNAHGQTAPDWMKLPPRPPRRRRDKRPQSSNFVLAGLDRTISSHGPLSPPSQETAGSSPAATRMSDPAHAPRAVEHPAPARLRTRQDCINDLWVQLSRRRPIGE